ncbi:MAG TPA: efflux transporter outer membrane subunit [Bryobacteraceae bacterium]
MQARIGIALAIAVLVLLCACNPGPKYARPPASAPTAFKEAPPQFKEGNGWKLAQPGDDKIRPKWWEMYGDPQINALEEQVQISNQTIVTAEANFRSARALVVSTRSQLFPFIGGTASYTNSRFSSNARNIVTPGSAGSTSSSSKNSAINNFSLSADLTYTVDLWHRIRNTIAANAFSAQASAADIATALLSTQAELASDYFQVRALDMQRAILEGTLANYREALNLTLTLFKAGIDSEQDVAQARTQLDTAIAQETDLGVARAQFEHAIATLIGKPASEFSLAVSRFEPTPPPVPVAVPSELLERRPDIAAAERRVASANAEIGIARAAYYPTLSLSASGGFQASQIAQWFTWPSRFWSLGPSLSQTLFDAGARRALNEQAEASYDASVGNYRQTVLGAFQAVEDNLAALRILAQEVFEQQTAINSSAHYLALALTRYKAGMDSYLNVITAQNAVLTNREAQVQTRSRQMTSSVSLIMALGGGWDAAQLPQMKDLLAKPGKWFPAGAAAGTPPGNPATPNPPAVEAVPLQTNPQR